MKRSRTPTVELLEGKVLLSAVARGASASPALVASVNPGLKVTLTTNQKVYREGQSVVMTMTETNTSNQAVTVAEGPDNDGFYVTRNGNKVWASNTGPLPMFLTVETLNQGQSFTQSATWNGHANLGSTAALTGEFVVHTQVASAPAVTVRIEKR